jgi:hypothetical protein
VQANAVAASGGSLTDTTTYYWVVTAINANGETVKSNEKSLTIAAPNQTATISWAASDGALKKLKAAAANETNGKQAMAEAALAMLGAGVAELVLDAEILGMLQALVDGGTLSASDRDGLLSRAAEVVGIAEASLGRPITTADVAEALAGDRPHGFTGPIGG